MSTKTQQNESYMLFKDLLDAFNQGTAEKVLALFTENAAIEYPYAASVGSPVSLNKQQYREHLRFILPKMPGIEFSEIRVYPLAETGSFWAEVHGEAKIPETGKKYEQDYVMYFTVQDNKFSFYREYWNPQVVLGAFDGFENTK